LILEKYATFKSEDILTLCFFLKNPAFSKISLRVHREDTLRGYLLLVFITLIVFVFMKKELGKERTVKEALLIKQNFPLHNPELN